MGLNPVLILMPVTNNLEDLSTLRDTESLTIWIQEWAVKFMESSRTAWLNVMRDFGDIRFLVSAIQTWVDVLSQGHLPEEFNGLIPFFLIAADFGIDGDSFLRLFLFRQYFHVS